jgi:hypothetical protein
MQGMRGKPKPSQRPSSEEISPFTSVNEIQELDSQEEQRLKTFEHLENLAKLEEI